MRLTFFNDFNSSIPGSLILEPINAFFVRIELTTYCWIIGCPHAVSVPPPPAHPLQWANADQAETIVSLTPGQKANACANSCTDGPLVKWTWHGYVPFDGGNVSEVSAEQSITTFLVRVDVLSLEVHHMQNVDHLRPIRRFKIHTVNGWQKHW